MVARDSGAEGQPEGHGHWHAAGAEMQWQLEAASGRGPCAGRLLQGVVGHPEQEAPRPSQREGSL
eukprot:3088836-Rhodomonas_salina.1